MDSPAPTLNKEALEKLKVELSTTMRNACASALTQFVNSLATPTQPATGSAESATESAAEFAAEAAAAAPPAAVETTHDRIARALREDAACRVLGVTTGVYRIADLAPFKRIEGGVPIVRLHRADASFDRVADDDAFRARLRKEVPYLSGFDLKAHGLCLAGGAVGGLLMDTEFHDLDLFLVGHESPAAALVAINALADYFYRLWGGDLLVHRTLGCVTFFDSGRRASRSVQVILRRYATAAEVIHGFDLGACAALWDGERVLVTDLGRVAFERGANVLNLAARRASYEQRLSRYFARGYDLVLPFLDEHALERLGGLPYLRFEWANVKAGKFCARSIRAFAPAAPEKALPAVTHYEPQGVPYGNLLKITAHNIAALAAAEKRGTDPTPALVALAEYVPGLNIATIQPDFNENSASFQNAAGAAFAGAFINFEKLQSVFGELAPAVAVARMQAPNWQAFEPTFAQLCNQRCDRLRQKAYIPFVIAHAKDKADLFAPLQSTTVTPAAWYGEAYASL